MSENNTRDQSENMGIPAPEGRSNLIDTDYVIGQDNVAGSALGFNVDLHGKVFTISALTILLFVIVTLALQNSVGPMFENLRVWLTSNLSWFFLTGANVFALLAVGLIFTPLGKVRLGGQEATPDFSNTGWFAMLFAAGMALA